MTRYKFLFQLLKNSIFLDCINLDGYVFFTLWRCVNFQFHPLHAQCREYEKNLPEKDSANMVAFLAFLDERILEFPKIFNITMRYLSLTK